MPKRANITEAQEELGQCGKQKFWAWLIFPFIFSCTEHYYQSPYIKESENACNGVADTRLFNNQHDNVIKWKHFPRNWPFVRGIHRSRPVTRSFDVFFDLRLNKRLSKQLWG